jgi:hypothetical protein
VVRLVRAAVEIAVLAEKAREALGPAEALVRVVALLGALEPRGATSPYRDPAC